MALPTSIDTSVAAIEEAPFLSDDQRAAIFYNNAARFLDLDSGRTRIQQEHSRTDSSGMGSPGSSVDAAFVAFPVGVAQCALEGLASA